MKLKFLTVFICLSIFFSLPLFAQTHSSVSLESQVYYILEQAEIRGLSLPLSGVRPYTQSVVITAINEILFSNNVKKINKTEREILEQYLAKFSKPKAGFNLSRGAWYNEAKIGKSDAVISANLGVSADIEGSAGKNNSSENDFFGTEIWMQVYLNGDLGSHVSYDLAFEGGLVKAPRELLGKYHTYYENFSKDDEFKDEIIDVYSEPLTHFPYSYKKRWDGSIFFFKSLSIYESWPTGLAGGYNLPAELTASFLGNKLIMRMGRISHDWASTSFGSSLAFNQMARPFAGIEAEFNPVSWFGIASLTGILEYSNLNGIKDSSLTFQNAFSVTMFQFRYKNYLFLDFVDAVVYPKRIEFGYISPIINSFFYQNNIGDFDNMAVTMNLKAQYPGLGNIWFSFFMDEMNFTSNLLTLDRQMFAMQAGMNLWLPFLSFSSIKLSYTKVSPYAYTHNRNKNPWYGDLRMETAYVNNGVSLGYYIPPNSDEILARFQTMPVKNVNIHFQYQLIRHGADFGQHAVDGSNLRSELDPDGRDTNKVLKRYFLHDGAYQWNHIVKVGAQWNLSGLPVSLFGETGVVISYFTDTKEPANSGKKNPYSIVNTPEYRKLSSFILTIGFRIFPR
jgi:hypothetical protein